ncbi:hypothetical protein [Thermacetogenium phaeum]|uniref:hypothetical protein n=1 Tax=Thermacetogenium phaeum TaxID=85874 RepID=UPI00048BAABE|nr:hypothetical protein [Thermacetogenium phaeum]
MPATPTRASSNNKIATAGGGHFADELRPQPAGYVKPDITDTPRMPVTGSRSSIVVHSRYQATLPVIAFIPSFAWGHYPRLSVSCSPFWWPKLREMEKVAFIIRLA